MDSYDLKVIREEGEDVRKNLDRIREEVRDSNKTLNSILIQLMLINDNLKNTGV